MAKGAFEGTSQVSQSLLDLRKTIEGLDPAKASGVRKLLGHHSRSATSCATTSTVTRARNPHQRDPERLYKGQDELRKDNAALEQEKLQLWETMQRLRSTCTSSSTSTHR